MSLFHINALASARFASGRGQWVAAARRSNLDLLSNVAESGIGTPSYADAFGRLDFSFSDATTASLRLLLATEGSSLHDGRLPLLPSVGVLWRY